MFVVLQGSIYVWYVLEIKLGGTVIGGKRFGGNFMGVDVEGEVIGMFRIVEMIQYCMNIKEEFYVGFVI